MKIGIDIDDTTLVLVKSMIKYADIYDIQILGRKGMNGNLGLIQDSHYLKVLYSWSDKTKYNFFNKYYKNVLEESVALPNAPEMIRKLKEEGNDIFFITARLTQIANCNTESITKKTLQDNNIPYDKLIINALDKLKFCQENGIQIFIEDSYKTCKQLQENGIKTFLMTTKMNEKIDSGDIERVKDWKEIYQKVKLYIKQVK